MFFKNCIEKELQKNVKVRKTESRAQDVPCVITFYNFCSAGVTEKAMGLDGSGDGTEVFTGMRKGH